MNEEINKIINWIEMSYTRLNYKEELLLVNYIKQLKQENAQLKDKIENATKLIEEIKLHYQQSPTMIPNVKINKLEDLLKEN